MLKLFYVCTFVLLMTAAALQLNDSDVLFWGCFYSLCALVPLLALLKIRLLALYAICIAYGLVTAGISLSGGITFLQHFGEVSLLQDMSPDRPYLEETRELLGSLIALAFVIACILLGRNRKANAADN